MKSKLMKLGLSEELCNLILDLFDTHVRTVKQYSKPKGIMAFRDNMIEIESLSKKLKRKLEKLSDFEKQILDRCHAPSIFDLSFVLVRLEFASAKAKKERAKFSQRQPFIMNLAGELRELLEANKIPVKKTRGNIFCKVLDILFDESEESEKSFNILRVLFNTPSL